VERHLVVVLRARRRPTTPALPVLLERGPTSRRPATDRLMLSPQGSIGVNMSLCFFRHSDQQRIATQIVNTTAALRWSTNVFWS